MYKRKSIGVGIAVLVTIGATSLPGIASAAVGAMPITCTVITSAGTMVDPTAQKVVVTTGWTCGQTTFEAINTFTGRDCGVPTTTGSTDVATGEAMSRTTVSCEVADSGNAKVVAELLLRDSAGAVTSRALSSTSRTAPAGQPVVFTATAELADQSVFGFRTRLLKNCTEVDLGTGTIGRGLTGCSSIGGYIQS